MIMEENTVVHNPALLARIVSAAIERGADLVQIHLHTNAVVAPGGWMFDACPKYSDTPDGEQTAQLPDIPLEHGGVNFGKLSQLTRPQPGAKCYLVSRRFANHMRKTFHRAYPGIHIDYLLGLEALYPTGADKTFKAYTFVELGMHKILPSSWAQSMSAWNRKVVGQKLAPGYTRIAHGTPVAFNASSMWHGALPR